MIDVKLRQPTGWNNSLVVFEVSNKFLPRNSKSSKILNYSSFFNSAFQNPYFFCCIYDIKFVFLKFFCLFHKAILPIDSVPFLTIKAVWKSNRKVIHLARIWAEQISFINNPLELSGGRATLNNLVPEKVAKCSKRFTPVDSKPSLIETNQVIWKKSIKTLISEMDADEWEKFRIN